MVMKKRARHATSAFTLVELMIVVAIIGVLAAIAIPAFSRYISKSRTPEQANLLNKLWLGSITYFTIDHMDPSGQALPKQFPGPTANELIDPALGGKHCGCQGPRKCPAGMVVWAADPVFKALNMSQPDPHSFISAYTGSGTGTSAQFTAAALGDLDCDTIVSQYLRIGGIDPANGDVTGQTQPFVINEGE